MNLCMFYTSFFVLILLWVTTISAPIIETLNLEVLPTGHVVTKISVGTPPQEFTVLVDTNSMHLCLFEKAAALLPYPTMRTFDADASSTFQTDETEKVLKYTMSSVEVTIGNDTVTLGKLEAKEVLFALIYIHTNFERTIPAGVDGILGLGFNYEDVPNMLKFSVLYELNVQKAIPYNLFKIEYIDKTNAQMVIGNYSEVDEIDTNWGGCVVTKTNVDSAYARWVCDVNYIELGIMNDDKKNYQLFNPDKSPFKFIFDTSIEPIFVPKALFEDLGGKALVSFGNDCKKIEQQFFFEYVCKSTIVKDNFKNINIVFPKIEVMVINGENAFEERKKSGSDEKEYVFIIKQLQEKNERKDLIMIGQSLLKDFKVLYDKAEEMIYFHSADYYIPKTFNWLLYVVIGSVAVSLAIILVILWFIFKWIVAKTKIIVPEHEIMKLSSSNNLSILNQEDDPRKTIENEAETKVDQGNDMKEEFILKETTTSAL